MSQRGSAQMLIRVVAYPVTSILFNAIALVRTIANSRVLLDGRWGRYLSYRAPQAINMLFYWTQAVNLRRYGRFGISPIVGGGAWKLTQWWHITLISNYAFYALGIILPIGGMAVWWLSHLAWLETVPADHFALVMGATLLSSMFFAQTFVVQNYNVAGWALLPLAIWGLMTGHPLLAVLAWMLMSFLSITSILVGSALSLGWAVEVEAMWPLLLIAPAVLKVAVQILAGRRHGGSGSLLVILKAIGVTKTATRYKRSRAKLFPRNFTYLLLLTILFTGACWWTEVPGRWMMLAAFGCLIMNEKIARFADIESMQAMLLSVGTAVVMASENLWLLLPLWLMINPFPVTLSVTPTSGDPLRLPACSPFPIGDVLDRVGAFFGPVATGKRVMFAFPDPEGDYDRVFGGYRIIVEAAAHVATLREFHMIPDWHFVFEHNDPGSPDCWASRPEDIGAKAAEWAADYVVVTRRATDVPLPDDQLAAAGLQFAGSDLDWADAIDVAVDTAWWNEPTPGWRLYAAERPK